MTSKHSSDERLLALLDGELGFVAAARIRSHLRCCWECRSRLAQLETSAQRLAAVRAGSSFLPPERVEAARRRFRAESAHAPESSSSLSAAGLAVLLGRRGLVFACAGMLSLAAVVSVWQRAGVSPASAPSRVEVRPPAPIPARDLGTAAKAVPSTVSRPTAPPASPPRAEPMAAALPKLVEREVAVLFLLHQSGACRGEDIQVERGEDVLQVRGLLATAGQREELTARLKALDSAVSVELSDLEHAASGRAVPTTAERVTRLASAAAGEALVRDWLVRQNTARDAVAPRTVEIANSSIAVADAAWSEAWALQDLRHRFAPVWQDLPESSRTAVLSMMRDHWSELQTAAAQQRRLLGGILVSAGPAGVDLLPAVRQWNEAVQHLFAPAEPVADSPSALVIRISSALARVEAMPGDDLALSAFLLRPTVTRAAAAPSPAHP